MVGTRSLRHALVVLVALFFVACGPDEAPVEAPEASSDAAAPSVHPHALRDGQVVLGEFRAYVDPSSGVFEIEMLDTEEWMSPIPDIDESMRTSTMPLYCPIRVTNGRPDTVVLGTDPGSVFYTATECGMPNAFPFTTLGTFCGTAVLRSVYADLTLVNAMAEILEVVPDTGHNGYTYVNSGGLVGVDTTTLTGPVELRPTDGNGGLFGFGDVLPLTINESQWVFEYVPEPFEFQGRIVAELYEECNGFDDDCDGIADEAAGCGNLGDPCTLNADCASGNCDMGFCDDDTCSDNMLNGTESDVDCGGLCTDRCPFGDMCNEDSDCQSNLCGPANTCVNFRQPGPNEVLITEFHADPVDASDAEEWFELYNTTTETLDLGGCVVSDDDTDSHQVAGELLIAPGSYLVMARTVSAGNGGDYAYANVFLGNSGDEITLTCDAQQVDRVTYPSDADVTGFALQLDIDSFDPTANDDIANFCVNPQNEFEPGEYGTPGAANISCDVPIDNCRLSAPVVDFDAIEGTTVNVSGQLRALGFTDQNVGYDPNSRVVAEIGYGPVGDDPSVDDTNWSFVAASGDLAFSNATDDQFTGSFTAPLAVGSTYKLAFRVSGDNGATFTYCDRNEGAGSDGSEDGFALANTPTMTVVAAALPPNVGEVRISEFMARSVTGPDDGEWVELWNTTGNDITLESCVLEDDGSNAFTISNALIVPANGHIVLAASSDTVENHGLAPDAIYSNFELSNSDDEIVLTCDATEIDRVEYVTSGSPSATQILADVSTVGISAQLIPNDQAHLAIHSTLSRTWCSTLPSNGYGTAAKVGTPGQANPECAVLEGCNLQFPASLDFVAPGSTHTIYGRVMTEELTAITRQVNGTPPLLVQAGIGDNGTDPSVDASTWTFVDTAATSGWNDLSTDGDIDEYELDITAPNAFDAIQLYTFRVSTDGGASWNYCDLGAVETAGSRDGFNPANVGVLRTEESYTIDFCVLETPKDITTRVAGDFEFVYGQVYIAGLTDNGGDVFNMPASIDVEYAFAPQGTAVTDMAWDWDDALPNQNNAGASGNNWEFEYEVEIPAAVGGPYDQLFRVSGDAGNTWTYCDRNGVGFANPGTIVPAVYTPTWGRYQAPKDDFGDPANDNFTADTGTSVTFYGRVFAAGLTDRPGEFQEASAEFDAEFGYGPAGSLPQDNPALWTWTAGTLNPSYSDAGEINNNEWQATITIPAVGTYRIGWRFRGASDQSWIYADQTGVPYGDDAGDVMNLISQAGAVLGTCPSDVLISEVIETSGANGAIEVWNCSDTAIATSNLSWSYRRDGNAELTLREFEFTSVAGVPASLPAGEVIVFCYPGFSLPAASECDAFFPTNPVNEFDGDDYFQLNNDLIPGGGGFFPTPPPPADTLGYYPGGFFGLAFETWRNLTLERDTCITDSDINNFFEFDTYHAVYPVNTDRSLGSAPSGLVCP